jgi:hypothetical protein
MLLLLLVMCCSPAAAPIMSAGRVDSPTCWLNGGAMHWASNNDNALSPTTHKVTWGTAAADHHRRGTGSRGSQSGALPKCPCATKKVQPALLSVLQHHVLHCPVPCAMGDGNLACNGNASLAP